MIAEALVQAPARAVIEAAMASGCWPALDAIEQLEVPDDLPAALHKSTAARAAIEAFPRSVKRGILEWFSTAKRAHTRQNRNAQTVRHAAIRQRPNQWRR